MPTLGSASDSRRDGWIAGAVAVVLALVVFGRALPYGFVYDDHRFVEHNPLVETTNPLAHLRSAYFFQEESPFGYYRPAVTWSLAWNRVLLGGQPWGFRAINLLLHAASAGLLVAILRRLGASRLVAALAALWFVVHPVQVEAVVWIVGRADLLATCLVLLCLWLHRAPAGAGRGLRMALLGPAYALALLSKETAVTLPALAYGLDLAVERQRGVGWAESARRAFGRWLRPGGIYLVLVALYLLLRHEVLDAAAAPSAEAIQPWRNRLLVADPGVRLSTALAIAGRYLRILAFPNALSVDYSYDAVPLVATPAGGALVASAAAVVALSAVLVAAARREPVVLFGSIAAGCSYLLVSHVLFAAPVIMAERFSYLPMIGISSAAAGTLAWALARAPGRRRAGAVLVAIAIVSGLALGARSALRTGDWRDDHSLFVAASRTTPGSAFVWNQLAVEQVRRGESDSAIGSLERAIAIHPDYLDARLNRARLWQAASRLDEAEREIERLAQQFPQSGRARLEWIQALEQRAAGLDRAGRGAEAARVRERILEIAREESERAARLGRHGAAAALHYSAAVALSSLDRPVDAEQAFEQAAKALDDEEGRVGSLGRDELDRLRSAVVGGLAGLLRRNARPEEASARYSEAAEAAERAEERAVAVELWRGAAETAVAAGQPERALAIYDRLPEDARATFWAAMGRARALLAIGDLGRAAAELERAIDVAPSARARAGALTDLATVAERGENRILARERLDRAIEADPDYAEARLKRGLLRLLAGETVPAETDLVLAVDRGLPTAAEAEAWCALERIAEGRGDASLAATRAVRCP